MCSGSLKKDRKGKEDWGIKGVRVKVLLLYSFAGWIVQWSLDFQNPQVPVREGGVPA